jgi:hypothetical protein
MPESSGAEPEYRTPGRRAASPTQVADSEPRHRGNPRDKHHQVTLPVTAGAAEMEAAVPRSALFASTGRRL